MKTPPPPLLVSSRLSTGASFWRCLLPVLGGLLLAAGPAQAVNRYWDANGSFALGAGTTPSGIWGISSYWSTAAAGNGVTPSNATTTAADNLYFSAGTDATGAYTITVNGVQYVGILYLEEGTITFTGGTIALGANNNNGGIFMQSTANNATINSGVLLVGRQDFVVGGSRVLTLGGVVSGAGGIYKRGSGTLILNGTNTYSGATSLYGGILSISTVTNAGTAGPLGSATNSPSNLDINSGTLQYTGASASTNRGFTLSGDASINVVNSGTNLTLAGASVGTGGLVKTGLGTLTLSGSNAHTGATSISSGELRVSNTTGSATGTGSVTLAAGATLSGSGRISAEANAITLNGNLSIGDSNAAAADLALGTTAGEGITLGSSGSMTFTLFSGAGAGNNTAILTASDLLVLSGDLSVMAGAQLILENPNNMTAWALGDQWRLWDVTGAGTITGSFNMADILGPALGGINMWSFDSSTGILSIVPEPGRATLILLGLCGLVLRRRCHRT